MKEYAQAQQPLEDALKAEQKLKRSEIKEYILNKNVTISHRQLDPPTPETHLEVLLKDSEFKKPNNKINAEFELVKMGNGLTGMIISDPYADKSHIQFTMKYGYYIDTVQGISHFGEHMVLQGSEKYDSLYPFFNKFFGCVAHLKKLLKSNLRIQHAYAFCKFFASYTWRILARVFSII